MRLSDPQSILNGLLAKHSGSTADQVQFLLEYIRESELKIERSFFDYKQVYQVLLFLQSKLAEIAQLKRPVYKRWDSQGFLKTIHDVFSQAESSPSAQVTPDADTHVAVEAFCFLLTRKTRSFREISRDLGQIDFPRLLADFNPASLTDNDVQILDSLFLSTDAWRRCVANLKVSQEFGSVMNWIVEQKNHFEALRLFEMGTKAQEEIRAELGRSQECAANFESDIFLYQGVLNYARFRLHQLQIERRFQQRSPSPEKDPSLEEMGEISMNYSKNISQMTGDDRKGPSAFNLASLPNLSKQFSGNFDSKSRNFDFQLSANKVGENNGSLDTPTKFDFSYSRLDEPSLISIYGFKKEVKSNPAVLQKSQESFRDLDQLLLKPVVEPQSSKPKHSIGVSTDELRWMWSNSQSRQKEAGEKGPNEPKFDSENDLAGLDFSKIHNDTGELRQDNSSHLKNQKAKQSGGTSRSKSVSYLSNPKEKNIFSELDSEDEWIRNPNIMAHSGVSQIIPEWDRAPATSIRDLFKKDSPFTLKGDLIGVYGSQASKQNDLSGDESRDPSFQPPMAIQFSYNLAATDGNTSLQRGGPPPFRDDPLAYENDFSIQKFHLSKIISALGEVHTLIQDKQGRLSQSFQREEEARRQPWVLNDGSFKLAPQFIKNPEALDQSILKPSPLSELTKTGPSMSLKTNAQTEIVKICEGRPSESTLRLSKPLPDGLIPKRQSSILEREAQRLHDPCTPLIKKKEPSPIWSNQTSSKQISETLLEERETLKGNSSFLHSRLPLKTVTSDLRRPEESRTTSDHDSDKQMTKSIQWHNAVVPTKTVQESSPFPSQKFLNMRPRVQSSKFYVSNQPELGSSTISVQVLGTPTPVSYRPSKPPSHYLPLSKSPIRLNCQLTGRKETFGGQTLFQIRKPDKSEIFVYKSDLPFYVTNLPPDLNSH